ncbi:MAG: hypothetical protein LBC27_01850 [Spirochaetaceae bacterium]|nr:hypothetical protein [Spirochaetaceae bacterium]
MNLKIKRCRYRDTVFFLLLYFAVFFPQIYFTSCTINQRRGNSAYHDPSVQASRIIEILDYQGYNEGAELADWATVYINGGLTALERLDVFASYYVFVAEQYSSNIDTLKQWADNFSIEHDFTQLVLLRVYRRLTSYISSNPAELYGNFFEAMIKKTASYHWPAAQKYDEMWALVSRTPSIYSSGQPDNDNDQYNDSRLYAYLIINVIEKSKIESGLKEIMDGILIDKSYTRAQISAINAIKSSFFNGF